jgi:hypothetical protein
MPAARPPWMVMDLHQVPEVRFEKETPIPTLPEKALENKTDAEKAKIKDDFAQSVRQNSVTHAAHTLAKINHVNRKGTDRFVQLLVDHRPDMQGLPFVMGDACRMSRSVSRQFMNEVIRIRPSGGFQGGFGLGGPGPFNTGNFGGGPPPGTDNTPPPKPSADEISRAKVAALMQIWQPDPSKNLALVKELTQIDHADATHALARLTVFSFERDVREAALAILKNRPEETFDQVIIEALRYPWPAVAQNAADAVVKLKRKDLAAHLVNMLEEPDPRAPAFRDEQCVPTVREVVRLNHHHNCITCHQPATSDREFNEKGFNTDFISAPVTLAGPDPRQQSFGYGFGGPSLSPDVFVRVDVTYLRQDFSLVQRNPDPQGPVVQRFDFLVRTRAVTVKDVEDYRAWLKGQGSVYRSPYQTTALTALRQLTGRNAAPTAAAWRAQLE